MSLSGFYSRKCLLLFKQSSVFLFLIGFVGALLVRLYGLDFGLPYLYEPDEPAFVSGAMGMLRERDLNPHSFQHPGSTTLYSLAGLYSAVYASGKLLGYFPRPAVVRRGLLPRPEPGVLERQAADGEYQPDLPGAGFPDRPAAVRKVGGAAGSRHFRLQPAGGGILAPDPHRPAADTVPADCILVLPEYPGAEQVEGHPAGGRRHRTGGGNQVPGGFFYSHPAAGAFHLEALFLAGAVEAGGSGTGIPGGSGDRIAVPAARVQAGAGGAGAREPGCTPGRDGSGLLRQPGLVPDPPAAEGAHPARNILAGNRHAEGSHKPGARTSCCWSFFPYCISC